MKKVRQPGEAFVVSSDLIQGYGPGVRWMQGLLVIAAFCGVALVALAAPEWVTVHLSADGEISVGTIAAINASRAVGIVLAVALLIVSANPKWIQMGLAGAIAGNARVWLAMLCGLGLAALILGAGFLVSALTGTHIGYLLRDPNAIGQMPFYYGALEYAGIILMAVAGGVAIFSGSMLVGAARRFLVTGGCLTLILVCDDLYMIHESSNHFYLNEQITFAIYGALALLFAATNIRHLLNSPFLLLAISAFFFAGALLVDGVPALAGSLPRGGEEMVELAGICFWSIYFLKVSRDLIQKSLILR